MAAVMVLTHPVAAAIVAAVSGIHSALIFAAILLMRAWPWVVASPIHQPPFQIDRVGIRS